MSAQTELLIRLLRETKHAVLCIADIEEVVAGVVHIPLLVEGAELYPVADYAGIVSKHRVGAIRRVYEVSGIESIDLAGLDDEPFGQFDGAVYHQGALCLEVGFDTIRLAGSEINLRSTHDEDTSYWINLWRTPFGTFRGHPYEEAASQEVKAAEIS